MRHKLFLFLILLLAYTPHVYGGIKLYSEHMKTSDGLPSNTIRYLHQDCKGFLWIGTLNGLSRYDGNSFITFQPQDEIKPALSDNRIYNITEDNHGFLWIGTASRIYSCYDLQKACFVHYTEKDKRGENYSKLYLASNGDIWLWHPTNGCLRVTHHSDRSLVSTVYKTEEGNMPDNQINFIEEDASGRTWIGTKRGLAVTINGETKIIDRALNWASVFSHKNMVYLLTQDGTIYKYKEFDNKPIKIASLPDKQEKKTSFDNFFLLGKQIILTSTGVYNYDFETQQVTIDQELHLKNGKIIRDNHANYWIYNHTGIVWYVQSESGNIKEFQLIPKEQINHIDFERYHIVHDSRGIIWISTYGNGLFTYNTNDGTLQHFTADTASTGCIDTDFLLYVTEDRNGVIWVGSEFLGITRITVQNESPERIYPENQQLLDRSNSIRMIAQMPDGNIGIGTRKGGVYMYNPSLEKMVQKTDFSSNIYAIASDSKEQIWLGTRGDGIKIDSQWYRHSDSEPYSLSNNNVFTFHKDRDNRMWIGTFGGGLDLALPDSNNRYKFKHFFQYIHGVSEIRTLLEDENGMFWMGTSNGICLFHPDSLISNPNNYHLFSHTNGRFCSNSIIYLFQDSKKRIWAGTSGMGIVLCSPENNYTNLRYECFDTKDGLVNNTVQSILEDDKGHLWIATEYGLSQFNVESHSFNNYLFASQTLGNAYSENCAYKKEDGKLIFGTNYGLVIIDPLKMQGSIPSVPVTFTDLYINGIQVLPNGKDSPLIQSLSYSEEIRLKHFQNSFQIYFSTFDYSSNGHHQYMYRLENYDKEWSTPSSLNFASYKYLKPGNYTLHVKVRNETGTWDERETTLRIIIRPPFWKTDWAFSCYALLALTLLYLSYRVIRNINTLRNRINVEKQLTEYKLVFFTNISHEFRTPLTLIQGAMEKMQHISHLPQEAVRPLQTMNKSTNRMLRLINQLLEFRKMQNNKLGLSLEETDVMAFLYEIFLSFGDVAEQKKIDFQFKPSIPSYKMFIDKGNIDKVTYNLLSNAFKYTPSGGRIILSATIDNTQKHLQIQVSDTGVGIPKEKRGELFKRFMQSNFSRNSIGVGLHLSQELVLVHKGRIEYSENEGGGSIFTIYLPADKAVYEEKDFLIAGNALLKEEENSLVFHPLDISSSEQDDIQQNAPITEDKRKILVIEDDNDIRGFLQEELSPFFEVETEADGKSGFKKACTYDADLIVCDVLMPGMTGFELTKKLKSDFTTSHIPIILLTALSSSEKHLEGIEAGADAYIAKPFSIKLLLARIFKLIEQRDKLRRKYSNEPGIIHPETCTTDRDKEFVDRLNLVLEQNLSRPELSIDEFAALMRLGRTVFYKKLRGLTGCSPNEYLRMVRMKKAAELLLSPDNPTVAEVAYQVGISDPFYFSKCFKAQFGVAPSHYQKGTAKDSSVVEEAPSDEKTQ
mgnify:FL=1